MEGFLQVSCDGILIGILLENSSGYVRGRRLRGNKGYVYGTLVGQDIADITEVPLGSSVGDTVVFTGGEEQGLTDGIYVSKKGQV